MRHLVLLIILFAFSKSSVSQTFEIGPFIGGANYIGDVGKSSFVNPNTVVGGAIAKWNRSDRHSLRFTLLYAQIQADDAKSNEVRRQERGYSFTNHIAEASFGLEFNFYSFDLHDGGQQSTPYLYTGITYFNTKHHYLSEDLPFPGVLEPQGDNWSFAIPVIFGYKQTLTPKIIGAIEIGARYTFTDNIDGSNPQELLGRRNPPREFGNTNTNDWYVFSGVTFTFTFGKKPCYCNI
ncbi:hypothetical protein JM83_2030 [Gillisia sp. Hel_I_86]|uniref:type IX secretion system protein PorG n=1 Tax=Gillisia sp. Hel_I_86 TaxID=1249981 RepID=UPI00119A6384|nr:DUF6089 family protein [Gillisia sp. Hel_I_86]TVZ27021.1 hypothetical protein JM83_2030 [Gillisia sp. Hel_I_86]